MDLAWAQDVANARTAEKYEKYKGFLSAVKTLGPVV